MALKAENQARASALFKGKQPAHDHSYKFIIITSLILLLFIGTTGWFFWQITNIENHPQFQTAPISAITPTRQTAPATRQPPLIDDSAVIVAKEPSTPEEPISSPATEPETSPVKVATTPTSEIAPITERIIAAAPASPAPHSRTPAAAGFVTTDNLIIKKSRGENRLDSRLKKAWQLFNQGNLGMAAKLYSQVLKEQPFNRDALLGQATIANRLNKPRTAQKYYLRLLERDPQDVLAQSALLSMLAGDNPLAGISRLNQLLESQPDEPWLHFAMGNLYAVQARWSEAQQAYFNAWNLANTNPDYSYNLAIALDHLGKQDQALRFYQHALDQSRSQHASFSPQQVQQRISDIRTGL